MLRHFLQKLPGSKTAVPQIYPEEMSAEEIQDVRQRAQADWDAATRDFGRETVISSLF